MMEAVNTNIASNLGINGHILFSLLNESTGCPASPKKGPQKSRTTTCFFSHFNCDVIRLILNNSEYFEMICKVSWTDMLCDYCVS